VLPAIAIPRIAAAVGAALAVAALFWAFQEYKQSLRVQGAQELALRLQVKQTQLWQRDGEVKDLVIAAVEAQRKAAEAKAAKARAVAKELEARKIIVKGPDHDTEIDFSECALPADVYQRLCEQLPCAAASLGSAPRID
jgi:hypothetical protein